MVSDRSPRRAGRLLQRTRWPLGRTLTAVTAAATAVLGLGLSAGPAAAAGSHGLVTDPVSYVDPLIGTSNAGNTYPGAVVPFGMLAWSPQNSTGRQSSTP